MTTTGRLGTAASRLGLIVLGSPARGAADIAPQGMAFTTGRLTGTVTQTGRRTGTVTQP